MNNQIDFKTKTEIEIDIDRITQILNCGIFSQENFRNPLIESAFIELVIRLRDLLYKCDNTLKNRINFNDDIVYLKYKNNKNEEEEVKDITDAVKYIRNAACHIESELNLCDTCTIIFNVCWGKCTMISTPNKNLTSNYEDDVCFFYGEQKLYLKRHIVKAFEESKKILSQYLIN